MKKHLPFVLVILFMALPASYARSATGDKALPLYISANKVTLSKKRNFSEYHGNVHINHGGMKLRARRAQAEGSGNKSKTIQAWGKPLVVVHKADKGDIHISAMSAMYKTTSSLLELSGEVSINFDGDLFTSERIYYHPPSGRLWSGEQNQPVRAQIKLKKAGQPTP